MRQAALFVALCASACAVGPGPEPSCEFSVDQAYVSVRGTCDAASVVVITLRTDSGREVGGMSTEAPCTDGRFAVVQEMARYEGLETGVEVVGGDVVACVQESR
jgi:hypothetical protein